MITILLTNDDGTTQVFVPQVDTPPTPEVITIPLDTDIKIIAR
jgi:hypothetical protein